MKNLETVKSWGLDSFKSRLSWLVTGTNLIFNFFTTDFFFNDDWSFHNPNIRTYIFARTWNLYWTSYTVVLKNFMPHNFFFFLVRVHSNIQQFPLTYQIDCCLKKHLLRYWYRYKLQSRITIKKDDWKQIIIFLQ